MSAIPHIEYIVAAYGIAALVIVAMAAKILWDYRTLGAELRALEQARGAKDTSE